MSKSRDLGEFPAAALDIDASGNLDVTGTVTADGLVVDTIADNGAVISAHDNVTTTYPLKVQNAAGSGRLELGTYGINNNIDLKLQTQDKTRIIIDTNGDVSFNEDTGTTPKFFWDASTERLGIGTSSPSKPLTVYDASTNRPALIQSGDADSLIEFKDNSTSYAPAVGATGNDIIIQTGAAALERLRINSAGNVGINTSSPSQAKLEVLAESDYSSHTGHGISIVSNANDVYTGMYMGTDDTIDAAYIQSAGINFSFTSKDLLLNPNGGNIGIGTASADKIVDIVNASTPTLRIGDDIRTVELRGGSTTQNPAIGTYYAGDFTIATNSAERLRITSSGNFGIGTSLPSRQLSVEQSISVGPSVGSLNPDAAGEGYIVFGKRVAASQNNAPFITQGSSDGAAQDLILGAHSGDGSVRFFTGASTGSSPFTASNQERMRITSAGDLALGSTNAYSHRFFARGSGADETVGLAVGANNTNVIRFYSSTLGTAGAIRVSAAGTSVAYNTSSDYRLKEDDIPMTGATERVKALRPINFAWKADGSRVDGFFAHELAEVVPEAASGTKDAMMDEEYEVTPAVVDAEGNETEAAVMGTRSVPDYQGIDQSKLVPLLTATIQELIARIEILEAK